MAQNGDRTADTDVMDEDTQIRVEGDFPAAGSAASTVARSKKASKALSTPRAASGAVASATHTPGFALVHDSGTSTSAAWRPPTADYIFGQDVHVAASSYDADDEDVEFLRSLRRSSTPAAKGRAAAAAAASSNDALLDMFEHAVEALETDSYVRKTVASAASLRHKLRLQRTQVQVRLHDVLMQYAGLAQRQDGVAYEVALPPAAATASSAPSATSSANATPTDTPTRPHPISARSSTERRRLLSVASPQATAAALDSSSDMHLPPEVAIPIIMHALRDYSPSVEAGAAAAQRVYDHWLRKRSRDHGLPLLPCFHVVSAGDVASDLPLHVLARIVGPESLAPRSSSPPIDDSNVNGATDDAAAEPTGSSSSAKGPPMRVKLRDIDANGLALARLRTLRNEMEHARILVDMLQKRERMKRERLRIIGGALQDALLAAPREPVVVPRKLRKTAGIPTAVASSVDGGAITAGAMGDLVAGLRALMQPSSAASSSGPRKAAAASISSRRSLLSGVITLPSAPPSAGAKRVREESPEASVTAAAPSRSQVHAGSPSPLPPRAIPSSTSSRERDRDSVHIGAHAATSRAATVAPMRPKEVVAAVAKVAAGREKAMAARRDSGSRSDSDADDPSSKCGIM